MANSLYAGRKARNNVWAGLCYAATVFGLVWLALILGTLLWKGVGGLALAVIAAPIIVRTTEDMLGLVPNTLREAASALGMPRSLVIRNVAYRAVMSGLITGVLLAVARMTGETAPLIFTELGSSL